MSVILAPVQRVLVKCGKSLKTLFFFTFNEHLVSSSTSEHEDKNSASKIEKVIILRCMCRRITVVILCVCLSACLFCYHNSSYNIPLLYIFK